MSQFQAIYPNKQYQETLNKLQLITTKEFACFPRPFFVTLFIGVIFIAEIANNLFLMNSLFIHLFILQILTVYIARDWDFVEDRKLFVLATIPIINIISWGLSTFGLNVIYSDVLQGIGLLLTSIMFIVILKLNPKDLGLTFNRWYLQLLIAPIGILFGLSISIVAPDSVSTSLITDNLLYRNNVALQILQIFPLGMVEAFLFIAILLRTMNELVSDKVVTPILLTVLYAVLFISTGNLLYILFMSGSMLFFGYMTNVTNNVWGSVIAFGIIKVILFGITPMSLVSIIA